MGEINLNDFLKAFLEGSQQLMSAKKSRNQKWLAEGAGLNSKTLSRFLRREVESMDKKNMVALAKFLLVETNATVLSSKIKSNLKKYLQSFEDAPLFSQEENYSEKLQRYFLENRDEALLVYLLSCNVAGLGHKQLFDLGELCRHELEQMLAKGWIYEEKNTYHAKDKNFVITKKILLQKVALLFLKNFHPENWNKKNTDNFFFFFTESLNKEGMEQVTAILREASDKINAIVNQSKNHGNIPCSVLLFHDFLSKTL